MWGQHPWNRFKTVLRWKGSVDEFFHLPNHPSDTPWILIDLVGTPANFGQHVEFLDCWNQWLNAWQLQVMQLHNLKYRFENITIQLEVLTCCLDKAERFNLPSSLVDPNQKVASHANTFPYRGLIIPASWNRLKWEGSHHTLRWLAFLGFGLCTTITTGTILAIPALKCYRANNGLQALVFAGHDMRINTTTERSESKNPDSILRDSDRYFSACAIPICWWFVLLLEMNESQHAQHASSSINVSCIYISIYLSIHLPGHIYMYIAQQNALPPDANRPVALVQGKSNVLKTHPIQLPLHTATASHCI